MGLEYSKKFLLDIQRNCSSYSEETVLAQIHDLYVYSLWESDKVYVKKSWSGYFTQWLQYPSEKRAQEQKIDQVVAKAFQIVCENQPKEKPPENERLDLDFCHSLHHALRQKELLLDSFVLSPSIAESPEIAFLKEKKLNAQNELKKVERELKEKSKKEEAEKESYLQDKKEGSFILKEDALELLFSPHPDQHLEELTPASNLLLPNMHPLCPKGRAAFIFSKPPARKTKFS